MEVPLKVLGMNLCIAMETGRTRRSQHLGLHLNHIHYVLMNAYHASNLPMSKMCGWDFVKVSAQVGYDAIYG